MRNISVAITKAQILNRSKRFTRRLGWKTLMPGTLLQPVEKGQGLKKGEKVVPVGGPIRVLSVRREPLDHITQEDVVLEGFPYLTPAEFVSMFCDVNGCTPDTDVTVIGFEYVIGDREQALTVELQGGCVVVSIGVDTLAHAFRHSPEGQRIRLRPDVAAFHPDGDFDEAKLRITKPDLFARDVIHALEREAEDGRTLVTEVIDQACRAAYDDGSEGIEYGDT